MEKLSMQITNVVTENIKCLRELFSQNKTLVLSYTLNHIAFITSSSYI